MFHPNEISVTPDTAWLQRDPSGNWNLSALCSLKKVGKLTAEQRPKQDRWKKPFNSFMNFTSSKGRCFTQGELLGGRKSKAVCSLQARSPVSKLRSLLASRELLFHRLDSEEPHWVTLQTGPTTTRQSYDRTLPPCQTSKSSSAKLLMLSINWKDLDPGNTAFTAVGS